MHEPKQREWDKQIHNAFLLGLSTQHVSQAQEIRDREATLKQLKAAAKAGTLPALLGTVGQLESDKVRLEQKVERTADQLRSFRVIRNIKIFRSAPTAFSPPSAGLTLTTRVIRRCSPSTAKVWWARKRRAITLNWSGSMPKPALSCQQQFLNDLMTFRLSTAR